MAATTYTYSIANDTLNGALSSSALVKEIQESAIITALQAINTNDDSMDIIFKDALSAGDKTILDGLVAAHDGAPLDAPPEEIVVQEEKIKTGGNFQAKSFELDVTQAQGVFKQVTVTFPIPVNIFAMQWLNKSNMEGDRIKILLSPGKVIGNLAANVAIDDDVIELDAASISLLNVGHEITLNDGVNSDALGRVLSINKTLNQVTVENSANFAFLVATPTEVERDIFWVEEIYLRDSGLQEIGRGVGTYLAANEKLRIRYQNIEGTTTGKTFSFVLEYKY